MNLILASSSPRRHQLLAETGYEFTVHLADVDESQLEGETPLTYVRRVAAAKARTVVAPGAVTLGADTVVVNRERALGKPADVKIAAEMLRALSGGAHQVMTGYACVRDGAIVASGVEVTTVAFRTISAGEIADYIATGEPMDRAGAYAIQGGAGAFVAAIEGSYTNVMGLPMEAVSAALADLGIHPS